MRFKELEGKSQKELTGLLTEDRSRLHALGMKRAINQVKDVREIREIRQRVARIMTKLNALKAKD
jgi:ribosomal protein L29